MDNSLRANESLLSELYKVPDNVADRFQNIMIFAKNMTLKDSVFLESGENSISKKFSELLLKYYAYDLTDDDIVELLNIVKGYNNAVDEAFNDKNYVIKKVYGLYDDMNIDYNGEIDITGIHQFKSYKNSYFYKLAVFICNNYINEIEKDLLSAHIDYLANIFFKRCYFGGKIWDVENVPSELNTATSPFDIFWAEKNYGKDINGITDDETYLRESQKIQYFTRKSVAALSKRTASLEERNIAEKGELINIFDIKLSDIKTNSDLYKILGELGIEITTPGSSESGIAARAFTEFQIIYKELNPLYRNIVFSDTIDYVCRKLHKDIEGRIRPEENSIEKNTLLTIRSLADDAISYDMLDNNRDIIGTTKVYKYAYTNPYMARRATESSLIRYFIGDNYISNSYGVFEYQKLEIYQFIDILEEVREYYYKVLLNESFINEEKYNVYEKLMITFMAVNRFIISKIDTLRNIDTFSKEDIVNFMKSFGLEKLAGILETDDFVNSEIYAKRLLKQFIPLTQYKGSKEIINILKDIFSIGNTELNIYRNILVKYNEPSESRRNRNSDAPNNGRYRFLRMKNDESDVLSTSENSDRYTDMDNVIGSNQDPYWTKENTPESTLDELGVDAINTKYIVPEIDVEMAQPYITVRILFAFVNYLFERVLGNGDDTIISKVIIDDGENIQGGSISLLDYINTIRFLWEIYLDTVGKAGKSISIFSEPDAKINITIKDGSSLYRILSSLNMLSGSTLELEKIYENINIDKLLSNLPERKRETYRTLLESVKPIIVNSDIGEYIKGEDNEINRDRVVSLYAMISAIPEYIRTGELDKLNLPVEYYELIIKIYERVFLGETDPMEQFEITNNDKTIIISKQTIENNKLIPGVVSFDNKDSIRLKIIEMLENLSTIINTLLTINMSGKDNTLIAFLKYSIEYYISYTNEIYNFSYSNAYSTEDENAYIRDSIAGLEITHTDIDSFYYDEKLTITESEVGGSDENNE